MYVRPEFTARTAALDQTAARGDFQRDKARGLPLLLIKRIGAKGEIVTSMMPASAVDIPATVLSELQLKPEAIPAIAGNPESHGVPLFETPEIAANRIRYYGAMLWTPQQSDFVGRLRLYRIEGHGWSDASWSFVQQLKPPQPP